MTTSKLLKGIFVVVLLFGLSTSGWTQFTDEEKGEILRAHNNIRGKVDPIAINMEEMEWNDELSYMAQFWAGNCEYELNENRHSQSNTFGFVGQSLAATGAYTVNYTVLIQTWRDLGRYYNYYTGTCSDGDGNDNEDGSTCAPYTQLVSANTYAVGCGAFRCDELRGAQNMNDGSALFFVCNYGPSGNLYPGEKPYQSGSESCSACPSSKPYCQNNLCSESGAVHVAQVSLISIALIAIISMMVL